MANSLETKLFSFPAAPTELATQVTTRLQNILQCPITMRYDVTYKLYRRQLEKLAIIHFTSSRRLFCLAGSNIYEVGVDYEDLLNKGKMWTLRQTMKVSGSVHEIESLGVAALQSAVRVSIGLISQGPSSKGLLLEVCEAAPSLPVAELQANDQMLLELMGPVREALLATTNRAPMIVSTGAELTGAIMLPSDGERAAAAYFELFAKL